MPAKNNITNISIDRPFSIIIIVLVVVILGVFFLTQLSVDLFPRIIYPMINIYVLQRGVSPEVMEETVSKVVESKVASTEDAIKVESTSQEGSSSIFLHFGFDTDIDVALQDASAKLDLAKGLLPKEIDPPIIHKRDPALLPVVEIGISSPKRDPIELRQWVEDKLSDHFLNIPGVASTAVLGGLEREIQVVLDNNRLNAFRMPILEVIRAINEENIEQTAGRITSGNVELLGRTMGRFYNVEQIKESPLRLFPIGGGTIKISDLADVVDTHKEQRVYTRLNGISCVRLMIDKQPKSNTVSVVDLVKAKIKYLHEKKIIPPDINLKVVVDQSSYIKNSIKGVSSALLQGGALAFIVVFIFLGSWRQAFIIGLSIPVSLLATFIMMGIGNLTLNLMSMGGLALGIGMLVDNSIVMLENIARHQKEEGQDPVEATRSGSQEVRSAVIASTITNLASVLPFLLISGLAALFFKELILTISFSILASLAVALTLVPALSAQLFKVGKDTAGSNKSLANKVEKLLLRMRKTYESFLRFVIAHRYASVLIILLIFITSLNLTRFLGSEVLPEMDDGRVRASITMPTGTAVEATNRVVKTVEDLAYALPSVRTVFTAAGGIITPKAIAENSALGSVDIQLAPRTERDFGAEEWITWLRSKVENSNIPGAKVMISKESIFGFLTRRGSSEISIKVQGPDLKTLSPIADVIISKLRNVPGLINLDKSLKEQKPELKIYPDRDRSRDLGFSVKDIGDAVRTAVDGTVASKFKEKDEEYDIRVLIKRNQVQSSNDIRNLVLFSNKNTPILLKEVADVKESSGLVEIKRENQNRVVEITGNVDRSKFTIGKVSAAVHQRLKDFPLPEEYYLLFGGEEETMREGIMKLLAVTVLAILLVYVVMAVQYNAAINPLVIMFTIPLALIGIIFALYLTGTPLGGTVLLGVIILIGVVVNNAIIMVEYIEIIRRDKKLSREEAAVVAPPIRLVPILMTTITTVVGMLPLAIGLSEGSEPLKPMAIAVIGGLTFSTLLTLFVVPCLYLILNNWGDKIRNVTFSK